MAGRHCHSHAVAAASVALTVLLAGCTSGPPASAAANGSATLTPAAGGSASAGDVRVDIPAHGVDASGRLTVSHVPVPAGVAAQEGVVPVGQATQVSLTGAHLTAPATVSFNAAAGHFDGQQRVPVVVWQDTADQWRWLPAVWKPGDTRVVAQTDHFSNGFLGSVDVNALKQRAAQATKDYFTGRSGVAQPACGDEHAARAHVAVTSDGGDTTKWCLGVDQGRTVLRIANNRRAYSTVTYPQGWQVLDGGGGGLSLDALVRSSAGVLQQISAPRGMAVRLVSGGDTLTLAMPAGRSGHVEVDMDIIAWAFGGIALGADVWTWTAGLAKKALGEASSGMWSNILAKVQAGSVEENWKDAWTACMHAISDNEGDHPLAPLTNTAVAQAVLKTVWGCVPSLGKAELTGNTKLAGVFAVSAIVAAVATVVSIVLTAANLIITGLRELWDTFAASGGNSDPIYDIVLSQPRATDVPPTTDVHTVRFDGIGPLKLGMTTSDLKVLDYSNQGNAYDPSPNATCVRWAKPGSALSASVNASGDVIAVTNFGGDSQMHTQVGNIGVGSTFAQVQAAFSAPGYQLTEKLNGDFGQGSNGVIVTGPGGAIGLGLDGSTVNWVAGVGTPGNAPTAEETGC